MLRLLPLGPAPSRRGRRPPPGASLAVLAALASLGGCASTTWMGGGGGSDADARASVAPPRDRAAPGVARDPSRPAPAAADAEFARSRLVARDFVGAMLELPELAPERTTLYAGRPTSRFGELLIASLQGAGYDLRLGVGGPGTTLGYRVVADAPQAADRSYTFHVRAGAVRLRRSYRVDLAGVHPVSAMQLHGAERATLGSDAAPFAALAPVPSPGATDTAARTTVAAPTRVATRAATRVATRVATRAATRAAPGGESAASSGAEAHLTLVKLPPPSPDAPPIGVAAPSRVSTARAGTASAPLATPLPPAAGTDAASRARGHPAGPGTAAVPLKRNMLELGRSNYAPLLAGYDTLRRAVMIFPNDSLHMGADNKRLARDIVAGFDPARDLLSVIGCSHGTTALVNGNETLAIGRSYRVKEEFMLAGIAPDRVLDEGCWAGTAHERMPARGVVVTHRRRAAG